MLGRHPCFPRPLPWSGLGGVGSPAWLHSKVQRGPEKLTHSPSHQQDSSLTIAQWSKIHQMPPRPLSTNGGSGPSLDARVANGGGRRPSQSWPESHMPQLGTVFSRELKGPRTRSKSVGLLPLRPPGSALEAGAGMASQLSGWLGVTHRHS